MKQYVIFDETAKKYFIEIYLDTIVSQKLKSRWTKLLKRAMIFDDRDNCLALKTVLRCCKYFYKNHKFTKICVGEKLDIDIVSNVDILDILIDKRVDIGFLKTCKNRDDYNAYCTANAFKNKYLTQEEFTLLRDMFRDKQHLS